MDKKISKEMKNQTFPDLMRKERIKKIIVDTLEYFERSVFDLSTARVYDEKVTLGSFKELIVEHGNVLDAGIAEFIEDFQEVYNQLGTGETLDNELASRIAEKLNEDAFFRRSVRQIASPENGKYIEYFIDDCRWFVNVFCRACIQNEYTESYRKSIAHRVSYVVLRLVEFAYDEVLPFLTPLKES